MLEADSRQRLQTPQLHFQKWIRKCFPAPSEFKSSLFYADRDHHDINELGPPKHEKLWNISFIMQLDVIFYKMYSLVLCFSHVGIWGIGLCSQPVNKGDACPMDAFCFVQMVFT